jgi:hypothetical protein
MFPGGITEGNRVNMPSKEQRRLGSLRVQPGAQTDPVLPLSVVFVKQTGKTRALEYVSKFFENAAFIIAAHSVIPHQFLRELYNIWNAAAHNISSFSFCN